MSGAIVLGCAPCNLQKGAEARIFVREENGKSKTYSIKRPNIFCTKRLPHSDAYQLQRFLQDKFKGMPDVEVRKVESGNNRAVVQVIGPREVKVLLPQAFLDSHASDILDWAFPVFSKVTVDGGKINVTGMASLEELLQLEVGAIDWELDKNRTDNYIRLSTNASTGEKHDFVRSIYDDEKPSQKKLVNLVEDYINHWNFPILASHNIAFDLMQPRDKVTAFRIGIDGSSPVIKGRVGDTKMMRDENGNAIGRKGFLKVELAGRQLFCSMSYARNNFWFPNNKLETVATYLDMPYEKGLDYGELEELSQKASNGDVGARETIKKYCLEDVKTHYKLAKRLLPIALKEALAFETDLISACFNAKSTLASKLRDKRYFEKLHTFRPDRTLEMQEFSVFEAKTDLLKKKLSKNKKDFTERGYFSEPLIIVFPTYLEKAFSNLLNSEKAARFLQSELSKSTNLFDSIVLHRDLEALCEEPLYDLLEYEKMKAKEQKEKAKAFFWLRYNTEASDVSRLLEKDLNSFEDLLKKAKVTVVNYTNRFLILKPTQSLQSAVQTLSQSDLVEFYGITNRALSGQSGRVLACVNGKAIASELDIYGRKGLRTDFERGIYSKLLDFITNKCSKTELFEKLREDFFALSENRVPKEDLIYYLNAGLEPWEYSWPAQRQERVKALRALGARKGDKVVFGYGIRPFDNARERVMVAGFLENSVGVDVEQYQDNFFGIKTETSREFPRGSISDLIYALCPASKDVERKDLCSFFEGKGDLSRWNVYEEHTQATLF